MLPFLEDKFQEIFPISKQYLIPQDSFEDR